MRVNIKTKLSKDDTRTLKLYDKVLQQLRGDLGDRLFLLGVANMFQEPAEGTNTNVVVGEIIERLSQWEY